MEPGFRYVAVPGSVIRSRKGGEAWVTTGDGVLELGRVQPQGGEEEPASDYFLGTRERLGPDE